MSSGFTKLDAGIVHSTIWVQPHDVLRVWIALLALADQNGFAKTAAPPLANLCMIPVDRMREILRILESPDEDSRSEAQEGRRIVKVHQGWVLVNHAAYRAKRDPDLDRERKREWDRQNRPSGHSRVQSADSPTQSDTVRQNPTGPTQAEAEADTEAKDQKLSAQPSVSRFDDFWAAYPKKVGKKPAEQKWRSRKLDAIADQLIADVLNRAANDDGWLRGYVPDPCTYLNQERWGDELRTAPVARAGPPAAPGKQMQGLMALEEMKRGLVRNRDSDGATEAGVLLLGSDSRR